MAMQGSPKKLAEDISKGFFYVTLPYLKTLSPTEMKALYAALKIVQRDTRSMVATAQDETKEKQIRLMRLNQVVTIMEAHARKYRMLL